MQCRIWGFHVEDGGSVFLLSFGIQSQVNNPETKAFTASDVYDYEI
jgi:hypothetical protein